MASNIDDTSIDATYPIAGQDNDSQGFRNNFSTVKNNFTAAKSEIEDLQTNTEHTLSEIFEFLEIPIQKIEDVTRQNKIKYPKMDSSTREILNNFFKPYNEKLFSLLGKKFNWNDE